MRKGPEKFSEAAKSERGGLLLSASDKVSKGRSTEVVQAGPPKSRLIKPNWHTQGFIKATPLLP